MNQISIKNLFVLLTFLATLMSVPSARAADSGIVEGEHYLVNNPAGKTKEPTVIEFFAYHCPACYATERTVTAWKATKDASIQFKRIPVFQPILTQAYYTARQLKVEDKVHSMIFHRFHVEKKPVRTLADVKKVFEDAGVDKQAFNKAFKSFYVKSATKKANKLALKFKVDSVPTFIINDKYQTSPESAGSQAQLQTVLSTLPVKQ